MKRKRKTPMQRALHATVNWYLYSNRPWPFGKSVLHNIVRDLLERREHR